MNNFITYAYFLLFGLTFGSYANVCIARWPNDNQLVKSKRSFCPWCKKKIAFYDNIPIISFFVLKRKCRQCQGTISWRYPIIELLLPIVWFPIFTFVVFNQNNISLFFLIPSLGITFFMLVSSVTDLDWKIIPDKASIGILALSLIFAPINPLLMSDSISNKFILSLMGIFVGAILPGSIAILGKQILKKEVMGWGDVKLLAGLGGLLGWEGILFSFFLGSLIGGVIASVGLITGKLKRHQYLPFGPFLNVGAYSVMLSCLYYPDIVNNFLNFFALN